MCWKNTPWCALGGNTLVFTVLHGLLFENVLRMMHCSTIYVVCKRRYLRKNDKSIIILFPLLSEVHSLMLLNSPVTTFVTGAAVGAAVETRENNT